MTKKKWEYCIIWKDRDQDRDQLTLLNKLGADSWELTTVLRETLEITYFFKREVKLK